MEFSTIDAALVGAKHALDLAQSMINGRIRLLTDDARAQLVKSLSEAHGQLLLAKTEQAAMLDRQQQIEKEVASLKAFAAEKEHYQLVAVGPNALAYAPKPSAQVEEPDHYLCANCFADSIKSFLQLEARTASADTLRCYRCDTKVLIPNATPLQPHRSITKRRTPPRR